MIDLINKDSNEINLLINKYKSILEVSNVKTIIDAQLFVIVIDEGVKYINENYNDLDVNLKIWCTLILKNKYKNIKTDVDVKKNVDDFIIHHKNHYKNYHDNLVVHGDDFDKDYGFVLSYIKKSAV